MKTVFIGGSRRFSRLNGPIRQRLDRIIAQRLPVLIGDANGADKAVQRYLMEKGHQRVEVFSATDTPRNNLGAWPVRVVRPPSQARGFDFFASKDRAMARQATVGLMLWDGESRGTLLNALRLVSAGKPVVVFASPRKAFAEVRTMRDFEELARALDPTAARRFHDQARLEGLVDRDEGEAHAAQGDLFGTR